MLEVNDWGDGRAAIDPQVPSDQWKSRVAQLISPAFGALYGHATYLGNNTRRAGAGGQEYWSFGSGTNHVRARFSHPWIAVSGAMALTLLVEFRATTRPGVETTIAALGSDTGGGGNTVFGMGLNSSGHLDALTGGSFQNLGAWVSSGVVVDDGRRHVAALSAITSASGFTLVTKIALNGRLVATDTFSNDTGPYPYTWLMAGGFRRTTDFPGHPCDISRAAVIVGPVADVELVELTRDLSTLFEPQQIWVPVSAVSSIPTLSDASATDITSTSLRPRVTLTF